MYINKILNKHADSKRWNGSIIVDAACCLPVFLIALGMMILLIMQCGMEESVFRFGVKAADHTVLADILSTEDTEGSLEAEEAGVFAASLMGSAALDWGTDNLVYMKSYSEGNKQAFNGGLCLDNIIKAGVSHSSRVRIPGAFAANPITSRTMVFRKWKGESEGFASLDNSRVYVFPKRGERYHVEGCSTMKEGCVETVLTKKLRNSYSPCQLCKPSKLSDGAIVYMFSGASKVFHRKTCASITKSYECITKSQAVAEGYTPCMHCCDE